MHPFLYLVTRLALGSVWLVAGGAKVAHRAGWQRAAAAFGVLPARLSQTLAATLPIAELVLGAMLLVGLWTRLAAFASGLFLLVFTTAVVINLLRGRSFECNCFGQIHRGKIGWWSVARNVALIIMALDLSTRHSRYLSLEGWSANSPDFAAPPPLQFVPVALTALGAGLLWLLLGSTVQMASVIRRAPGGPASGLPEVQFLHRLAEGRSRPESSGNARN